MSSKYILSLIGVASLSAALPHNAREECAPGTWFSTCSNGYTGCFSYDPCNLPTIVPGNLAPTPTPTVPGEVAHPTHYAIYVEQPNHDTDALQHLDLRTNLIRQVVEFNGIPSTAKRCSLNWRQGPAETRNFDVTGNGLVSSRELKTDGFPCWSPGSDVKINPTTIAPFVGVDEFSAAMDFTNWDTPQQGPAPHSGPSVQCPVQGRIILELVVNFNSTEQGTVFLEDDAQNGLYIAYE